MEVNTIYNSDCLEGLKTLPDKSVHCCVTSPPYWGLRDYGVDDQLGLESTPEEYVQKMVLIFNEVKRVLRDDGTLWLNIGDSYAGSGKGWNTQAPTINKDHQRMHKIIKPFKSDIIKPKDLVGIPWMVAFSLRNSGWYLRSEIIWYKKSVMPESVTDRPTKCHEQIFLLSKAKKYYYDYEAIKERAVYDVDGNGTIERTDRVNPNNKRIPGTFNNGIRKTYNNKTKTAKKIDGTRNKRSVWEVNTLPFKEAHFAVYPEKLIVDCIKAGCLEGGIVLDPFMGSGTTAVVARKLNRNYIGFELNPEYIEIAERRLEKELGMFI